ncbi:MAG: YebC/PmpR family DNA-binding transcriptional regulator [Desulfobacterales bacterium]|uniref:Probable transcriptional regulatory protein H8E80_03915 n=1 Tax=Candidatus Desulfaltia bathyphila TaxID=2841697 RepID=A0A8J6N2Z2_9BACT|nr:YebC/PmpR family DNA-binding transcriptional regulator [Candidatus Desulfaltia bathyphila]MBL7195205.1 YebC/PmpR family DNA-binding transcriptional regulator [Desulfobacterales bacterium]MBL7207458.1 YebC/PmpR family DNA-binding transcriptional regulator [Desulfobacterales bacterium]
MSGHSKWSSIKHKKGITDARRGKVFSKLIKEITVAARTGGGDPSGNPRLRTAILAAKSENMPKDNIERAIKKGTGELEGVNYEESIYEGYGPGGAAVLIESVTDNKNRAVADIRHIFSKCGGNLGENGCVFWMFDSKGYIDVEKKAVDEDKLMEIAIEAGAEDVREDNNSFEIITEPNDFEAVKTAINNASIPYVMAEITMLPQTMLELKGKEAEQMIKLMETLEDCDDVQKVYTNADIPDELVGG